MNVFCTNSNCSACDKKASIEINTGIGEERDYKLLCTNPSGKAFGQPAFGSVHSKGRPRKTSGYISAD